MKLSLPRGFAWGGVSAGIKKGKQLDLALAECPAGAAAAAVFTTNRVVAAPVEIGRRHLRAGGGRVRAVVINSGNANCATGAAGWRAAETLCRRLARILGCEVESVLPSSTGVIGVRLPVERCLAGLPALVRARRGTAHGVRSFVRAIMTTDTRPKLAAAQIRAGGKQVRLLGVAKGAGMIHPRLATMLVFLFTDAAARPAGLGRGLRQACESSFNRISIDGDTSTNDTVLLLASGASGVSLKSGEVRRRFQAALESVCGSLARQIVADGEGVKHVVTLEVEGARSEAEAVRAAQAIATSPLVKTAWAGADPNWGRILAALGRSGVAVRPDEIDIYLGRQQVCRRGAARAFDERAAHRELSKREFTVRVRLGRGRARTTFWTTDLTADYVRVNASYPS